MTGVQQEFYCLGDKKSSGHYYVPHIAFEIQHDTAYARHGGRSQLYVRHFWVHEPNRVLRFENNVLEKQTWAVERRLTVRRKININSVSQTVLTLGTRVVHGVVWNDAILERETDAVQALWDSSTGLGARGADGHVQGGRVR
jgi:hypothetical protein